MGIGYPPSGWQLFMNCVRWEGIDIHHSEGLGFQIIL